MDVLHSHCSWSFSVQAKITNISPYKLNSIQYVPVAGGINVHLKQLHR